MANENIMSMEHNHGGYISKLFLNDNQIVNINKDDIVIFVGPNNAYDGKMVRV